MYGAVWLTQTLCSLFETAGPTPRQPCSIDAPCERKGTKIKINNNFRFSNAQELYNNVVILFTTLKVRIIIE
jgi:hypothetical protein